MKNKVLEFINSFKMVGNKDRKLVNIFELKTSKEPINNETHLSIKLNNLSNAIEFVLSLHETLDEEKIKNDLINSLKQNLISEHQPFHLVFYVKDVERIF